MRTSLGISAGTEVVCSALVVTAPNDGAQTFDYRVVSADGGSSDLGDLVASSIELMTTQLPTTHFPRDSTYPIGVRFVGAQPRDNAQTANSTQPTGVAVAYRGKEQEQAIRSATAKQRELRLVPESTAALAYLRHTGLFDRYDTVAIIDFGASGLTVTVTDQAGGEVLQSKRTTAISGKAIDNLVYHHLVDLHYVRRGTRPNRGMLTNRGRAAKEHLSIAPAVTIDHVAGQPLKLTRTDFEALIAELLHETAEFASTVFDMAPQRPDAIAVIGGGANIPAVVDTLTDELGVPVFTVPEPDAVIAKGAALVADSMQPSMLPVTALGGEAPVGTLTKVVGTLAGAIAVVALIIGYGVKTFAPTSDDAVSPAGTTSSASQPPIPTLAVVPSTEVDTTSTSGRNQETTTRRPSGGAIPSTTEDDEQPSHTDPSPNSTLTPTSTMPPTPTLRPDPNLPPIPFPELLGPLFGNPAGPPTGAPEQERDQGHSGSPTPTPGVAPEATAPSSTIPTTPTPTSARSPEQHPPRPDSGSASG